MRPETKQQKKNWLRAGILSVLLLGANPLAAATLPDVPDLLRRNGIPKAALSASIISLKTGKTVFKYNDGLPLNPASAMKLLTSLAAFETLGADHRYPTEFFSYKPDKEGKISGLWVKGYGSPALVDEELRWIAKNLKKRGIRHIDGPIYVDDTYFGPAEPIRFPGTTGKSVYRVVTGALSYNFNRPESLLFAARSFKKNGAYARGTSEVPERPVLLNKEILDPAIYTGLAIKTELERQGIPVTGKVQFQRVPLDTRLLLFHSSQRLAEIMAGLNKFSNNFIAEQVLRSLGAARYGQASRTRGLKVLSETLAKVGGTDANYRLHNGSGLSRHNRLAAAHLTQLLRHALKASYGEDYTRALSIGGVDGTLLKRFRSSKLKGHIWAKTGTLYSVSTLAGYFLVDEEPYCFAILVNDFATGPAPAEKTQQMILEHFVKYIAQKESS